MRPVVCALVFVLSLSATFPSPGSAGSDEPHLELLMERTDRWILDLTGTGWALVQITAVHDMELNFTLTHDTIDDLCLFSDDGDGLYDQGHVSAFQLWKDGDSALSGERFWWHGAPGWAPSPSQSGECGESDPITLDAGDTAWFVAADTTGGYTVALDAEFSGYASLRQQLALTPRADFQRIDPVATETTVFASSGVDVLRERTWSAPLEIGHSLVMFADWGHETGATDNQQGAYATTYWDTKKLTRNSGPDNPYASILPTVDADTTGTNGHHWSMQVRTTEVADPGTYEARYTRGELTANIDSRLEVGAYAISVPLL